MRSTLWRVIILSISGTAMISATSVLLRHRVGLIWWVTLVVVPVFFLAVHLVLEELVVANLTAFLKYVLTAIVVFFPSRRTLRIGQVVKPPKGAKFLLLLIPQKHREHLPGDLEEEFSTVVLPQYGFLVARWWYRWQVAASLMPFVWTHVKRVAGLILIWKAVK